MRRREGNVVSGYRVHTVPMYDTSLGREAGYADDAELIEAAQQQRAEIEALLSPEGLAKLDAAEEEITRRFLFGA
jgi:uroporphyrinogen-III synthase